MKKGHEPLKLMLKAFHRLGERWEWNWTGMVSTQLLSHLYSLFLYSEAGSHVAHASLRLL